MGRRLEAISVSAEEVNKTYLRKVEENKIDLEKFVCVKHVTSRRQHRDIFGT